MTNRFIVIAGLAVLSGAAFAQSFSESFDTGPAGWTATPPAQFGLTAGGDDIAFSSGTWHATNFSVPLGTTGWFNNPAVFATHSGAGHANANFNNTTGDNTISSFLMSPVRTFNNGDTISFWTRTVPTPAFPDRLRLRLSLNGAGTAEADFATVLLSVNEGLTTAGYPNAYTQFTGTVSGLGSPTSGRFAFAYQVTNGGPAGANSDFIGVDDVVYTAVPEPATMAVLGLGAAALLRRRRRN